MSLRSMRAVNLFQAILALVAVTWLPQPLHADEPAPAGFGYPMFDGQSLQGWTVEGDCKIDVVDGLLTLEDGNGWLRSDATFTDFVLHIEWKALKASDYDAGIYIRTLAGGKPFPKASHQINLLQGKEGNIGNIPNAESTGLIKPGAWNVFDMIVEGDKVLLEINGRPAYKVAGLKQASGYIGLQCEVIKGGKFQFRNIRVTELRHRALFNGKDLTWWTGAGDAAEKCWKVQDGLLTCTGAPGPWLRSKVEYDNFNLRLEYLVSPGGNSGVYVRVPADGNHHRDSDTAPPAGFEVQILDDAAAEYKNLKDYQYTGSVYDIAAATRRVARPAGQWNTLEVNCNGSHVTTTHNGVVVVDAVESKFPLLKQRLLKGYLGLQNHSTVVKFRNVRIGPAM